MSLTNPTTAQAATLSVPNLSRPLTLIGIFTSPESEAVLVRDDAGAITRLEKGTTEGQMALIGTGDGWAMVSDGQTIHRLTML